MIEKADKILENLVELAYAESTKVSQKGYFSKDFAEACGIVISLAYGRWGSDNDKQANKHGS